MASPRLFSLTIGAVAVTAALLSPLGWRPHDFACGLPSSPGELGSICGPSSEIPSTATPANPRPVPVSYTPSSDAPPSGDLLAAPSGGVGWPTPPSSSSVQDVIRSAFAAYAAGDLRAGDALASQIAVPVARTALEWAALHAPTDIGFDRFADFLSAHPSWPGADWAVRAAEETLWRDKRSPELVLNFFAHRSPETAMGALALARAWLAQGETAKGSALAREVWRDDDLFPELETELRQQFGSFLTAADDKYRADRLLYKGDVGAALRAAGHAGADELSLTRARVAAMEDRASPAVMRSVPASLRQDPSYLFSEILRLRQTDDIVGAARVMLSAPSDPKALIDPDAWWLERRWIARKLLDRGDPKTAYQLSAGYTPGSPQTDIDAEFQAGWIALRFLSDAKSAQTHFTKLAAIAKAPVSQARADYWLGRAQEALGSDAAAILDFRAAAAFPTTYYGQLAAAAVGAPTPAIVSPAHVATGAARDEAIRVVEILDSYGQGDLALSLAIQAAHTLDDQSQLAALAAVGVTLGDARETLAVGKIAARRGFALDSYAFPTFGVPAYSALADSAPPAIVYAVARQESAFRANALSSAGAQGIMQMIVSTAKRTAERFKIPFDARRLEKDPAFNAQLGAAHLGLLLGEQRGSLILTFAAYNAGGGRVKQWIDAYGDPRRQGVDPVDWIERIPIAETRDYVQRVMENYNVYKARFAAMKGQPPAAPPVSAATLPKLPPPSNGPAVDAPLLTPQAKL
jgi:soluble lytic murein transglycosylase